MYQMRKEFVVRRVVRVDTVYYTLAESLRTAREREIISVKKV